MTNAEPFRFEAAATSVGIPGAARGVAGSIETAEEPSPNKFVATTVKVYATPFVSPETVQEVVVVVQNFEPGSE